MALTVPQRQTLFADIQADPAFAEIPNTPEGSAIIAAEYNLAADPAYIAWRSNVSTYEVRDVLVWSEYDSLSVSKQNAFEFLCSNGIVNASRINVREGIASIFAGPNSANTRAALIAIAKRTTSRIERLLASGTGSDASPGTMTFEGILPWQEVHNSRNM